MVWTWVDSEVIRKRMVRWFGRELRAKSLGRGWSDGLAWVESEVIRKRMVRWFGRGLRAKSLGRGWSDGLDVG